MGALGLTVVVDAHDPSRLARFWAELLGRETVDVGGCLRLPGAGAQLSIGFAPGPARGAGQNRMHAHLTSEDPDDQERTVALALALGGSHLDVGQRPEEGHVVLADPEGNEFCVIEPGNAYLAGCGFLGELACDGTREVGLFWSEALGWPLVWDQDEETAIQSPRGGTKVAWGGPPVEPIVPPVRQRFVLTPADGDQRAAVDRLVALGATPPGTGGYGAAGPADAAGPAVVAVLADPDGNEFHVTAG